MPTTIYTKKPISSIGHDGKEYEVKNGAVEVPDSAVDVLCGSHGFTKDADAGDEQEGPIDITTLSKVALIALNADENLGAELKMSMTKDEIFALVSPLWEAKIAA